MADQAAIIIKKIKKGGHGAHHGGAWKIAYADFVTAMMAFFLLLWLLNSVTQEQLEGISNYFAPVTASSSTSGAGDILGGKTITEDGASANSTSRDAVTVDLPPPKAGTGGEANAKTQAEGDGANNQTDPAANPDAAALQKLEQQQFQQAKTELQQTIAGIPQMRQLAKSLLVDNTPEGLRIQLVDQDGLAMFPSGGSDMYLHTKKLLELVAKVILELPQKIAISGHTDAVPFVTDNGYSNWELSSDRANAARRELLHYKVPEKRISRVVGKAETDPLLPEDPKNARNRRLSIILLRGTGETNPANAAAVKKVEDALPGLSDIKRQQLNDGTGSTGGAGVTLDLQPAIEAQ